MARTANRFNALCDETKPQAAGMMHKPYRVALYARLSDDRDDRKSESIDNQLDIMKSFLSKHPELSDYREYADRGFTGTNFDRPEFSRMMDDVKSGRLNCIIVKDLSRFGRDYLETTNYIEVILPFLEVRLISVNDNFDTDKYDSNKELEVTLKNLANDMYAKDISRKICSTKKQHNETGKYSGGKVPYGYKLDGRGADAKYVIDEKPAEIVREIFKLASGDMCVTDIATYLDEKGISSPGGYWKTGEFLCRDGDNQSGWVGVSVSRILSNEAYIGNIVKGQSRTRLYENEKRHRLDRSEWIVIENVHEPIISKDVFQAARKKLEERTRNVGFSKKGHPENANIINRYKGLVFCGACGRSLTFCHSWKDTANGQKRYSSYMCTDRNKHRTGMRATIQENKLDRIMEEELRAEVQKLTDRKITAESCSAAIEKRKIELEKSVKRIEDNIARLEAAEFDIYQKYCMGIIGREEYLGSRDGYERKLNDCLRQMDDARERLACAQKGMADRLRMIKSMYRVNGKRQLTEELIRLFVERIDVHHGKGVVIKWRFSDMTEEAGL